MRDKGDIRSAVILRETPVGVSAKRTGRRADEGVVEQELPHYDAVQLQDIRMISFCRRL